MPLAQPSPGDTSIYSNARRYYFSKYTPMMIPPHAYWAMLLSHDGLPRQSWLVRFFGAEEISRYREMPTASARKQRPQRIAATPHHEIHTCCCPMTILNAYKFLDAF